MKKKIYILCSILILLFIFVFQYKYLINNTVGKYVLDNNYEEPELDISFYFLNKLTNGLIEDIDSKKDKNITLIYNEESNLFNQYAMGFLSVRYEVLPMNMDLRYKWGYGILGNEAKDELIDFYNIDYVLLLGRNTSIYNIDSEKDYTLYKVVDKKNNLLEEVKSFNFGLYDLYLLSKTDKEKEDFNKLLGYYQTLILTDFNFSAIDFIRNYAIDLYEHEDYEKAIEISNFYLENVDSINEFLNVNMGYIYKEKGDYETSLKYFQLCLNNSLCNKDLVNKEIDEINERLGNK